MKENMYKIATVLADRTRYSIYDFVCSTHDGISVQDVAQEFSIHANVARLHLGKLEDSGLIQSLFDKKEKKGGRPNKLYRISNETISFHFPYRDFSLLTTLAMKTLSSLGPYAWKAFIAQNYQHGRDHGLHARNRQNITVDSSTDQIIAGIKITLSELGLNPVIELNEEGYIIFNIRNCTFKDSIDIFPEILCKAHQKLLQGLFESYFEHLRFEPVKTLQDFNNCSFCHYRIQLVPSDSDTNIPNDDPEADYHI
ncbi:hypothetical protein BHU72_10255 [Desulfuribacillus stibiiarsenatis]|uniref:Transcriptional regulator n=1 Tax=Desulfuribacillus stibiiarsenatis TaxID=1390249 RepID=A0A1E5L996_9FIRM|nr:helix-turn-helix domain-containing protein [Desulfuribacillus stibiiarsenatis]OEH86628.1 hypothetical protein BHU72_10255 [Desulfuribacillus stibiiarsenatis]